MIQFSDGIPSNYWRCQSKWGDILIHNHTIKVQDYQIQIWSIQDLFYWSPTVCVEVQSKCHNGWGYYLCWQYDTIIYHYLSRSEFYNYGTYLVTDSKKYTYINHSFEINMVWSIFQIRNHVYGSLIIPAEVDPTWYGDQYEH